MKRILNLLALTSAAALIISLVLLLLGVILGWSAVQFSDAFFWAGSASIILGLLTVVGGFGMRSSFKTLYSQSSGDMNTLERTQQWIDETSHSYSAYVFLFVIGLILIGVSILIGSLFV
jgi:hypothetical protein